MKHYDAIVIGSGGGTKLVRPVADLGRKVALAEMESPGGTCLNRGCIPSKMLIYPADILHLTKDLSRLQLSNESEWKVDFEKLIQRISDTVDSESADIPSIYENHPNIDYYPTKARFVGKKEIHVGNENITADKIFLAASATVASASNTDLFTSALQSLILFLRRKIAVRASLRINGSLSASASMSWRSDFFVKSSTLERRSIASSRSLREPLIDRSISRSTTASSET